MEVEKGYLVGIMIALIVVASVVGAYFVLNQPANPGYNTIYLLDSQKKAVDYPAVLVANQNSTFNVYVTVENHTPWDENYQVQTKIVQQLTTFPLNVTAYNTYQKTLPSNGAWETPATVSLNQPGNYSVVFELWQLNTDPNTGKSTYEFTNDFCVLHLQVASQ
jgi:uncharacterized membrane protein